MNVPEVQRKKLLGALAWFITHTHVCCPQKLFGLLYGFDFEIYRQTGKSVTGLLYRAYPEGPVPESLYRELRSTDYDRTDAIKPASHPFDDQDFTLRELAEMTRLAEIYRDAHPDTQAPGGPWHQTYWANWPKPQAVIPYRLALDSRPDSITTEQADIIEEEERELQALFR